MTQWWHFVFSISGYKFSSVRLLLSLLWAFCLIFLNFPPGVISKDSKPLASIIYFLQHKSFWTVSPPFFLHKWILSYYLCGLAKWCHVVARDRLPSFSSPEVLFEVKTHAHLFSLMIKCRPCFKLAALAFRAPFLVQRHTIVARFLLNFILLLPSDSKLVAVLCIQSLHWNSKFSGVDYGNLIEIVWLSLANRLSGWTSSPLLCKSEIAHSHCVLLHTMFISTLTVKT